MNSNRQILGVCLAVILLSSCSYMPSWMGGESKEKPKLAGTRIAALPVAAELKPDAANAAAKIPTAIANDNWPQHGGGFSATNGNLSGGAFTSISHAAAGKGESFENTLVPTPVVGGSMVFAMDQVGNVSAHDFAAIENVRWVYSGLVEEDAPGAVGGGLAYEQGKLYAVSGRGMVAAVDATSGKEIWHKALHIPFRSAPKIADGKLFATSIDNQLYALNVADGAIVWNHRGINEAAGLLNSVSPAIDGSRVVVPYSSGEVYVLADTDGKEVWSESLSARKNTSASSSFSGIGGDPVVDGGVVFSVSSSGMTTVQAVSTGQHVWERPIGSVNTPWLAGDNLYMLSNDNTLINFVKYDGHIRWATKLQSFADMEKKKEPITWKGPVLVSGKLAVVGSNGQLLFVAVEDGKIINTQEIPDNIYTAPVVASGRMYLVGQDARLYSLK